MTSWWIYPHCDALTPFSIDIHTWQCWCMMWCSNSTYILRICIVKWAGHFTFSSVESAYSLSLFGQGNGILFRDIVSLSFWPLGHPSRRAEDWLPLKKIWVLKFKANWRKSIHNIFSRFGLIPMVCFMIQFVLFMNYHTHAIITRGLYIFHPLFEGQKRFFKEVFFRKFCLYVWLVFKSGL